MAELNIAERQAGDVTVLDMSGKITIGEGSVALRTAVRRLLEEGKKRILLAAPGENRFILTLDTFLTEQMRASKRHQA